MSRRGSNYPPELRERAVRMVAGVKGEYPWEWAAIAAVASRLGIGLAETLRKWVRRAEVHAGDRPGVTTEERAEIKAMKKENAELRRANAILKAASSVFGASDVFRGFGPVLTCWSAAGSGCARHRVVPRSAGAGRCVGGGTGRAVGSRRARGRVGRASRG